MSEYIVASCSGGKDSTAMVLKELEMGGHIDEIVFCNVAEWPQAVDTVRKLARETGVKLTELKSD
jgi:diphthamide synthase (EF-2-diphthine--ammonia ligase)